MSEDKHKNYVANTKKRANAGFNEDDEFLSLARWGATNNRKIKALAQF